MNYCSRPVLVSEHEDPLEGFFEQILAPIARDPSPVGLGWDQKSAFLTGFQVILVLDLIAPVWNTAMVINELPNRCHP